MRILFAAIAATLLTAAVAPATAAESPKATVILNDGRTFYINVRCHLVGVGGSGYCINRVIGR